MREKTMQINLDEPVSTCFIKYQFLIKQAVEKAVPLEATF
jgi:hypothetical protein